MAPIYLCPRATSKEHPPSFEKRKIGHLMPGVLDELFVQVEGSVEHNFTWYMANLNSAIAAQLGPCEVATTGLQMSLLKDIHLDLPTPPVLGAQFDHNVSESEVVILTNAGMVQRDKPNLFVGSPSSSDISKIFALGPRDPGYTPGTVPPEAYVAYLSLLRGAAVYSTASRFLMNHPCENLIVDTVDLSSMTGPTAPFSLKIIGNGSVATGVAAVCVDPAHTKVVHRVTNSFMTPLTDTRAQVYSNYPVANASVQLRDQVAEGFSFPYFDGMTLPDRQGPLHEFNRLFARCISTPQNQQNMMSMINRGYKALSMTRSGRMLAHMYMAIRITLQCPAAITFILSHGSYHGFVLQGLKISKIILHGVEFKPVSPKELQQEITTVDGLAAKKSRLAEYLNTYEDGTVVSLYNSSMFNGSRSLIRTIHGAVKSNYGGTFEQDISAILEGFDLSEKYSPITKDTISIFLRYVETGDETLLDERNGHIDPVQIHNNSRIAVGLGIFGHAVPSLNFGPKDGKIFQLPTAAAEHDPNMVKGEGGKRALQYLAFAHVPLAVGIGHWNALLETGRISYPIGRKNKSEFIDTRRVTFRIAGEVEFVQTYEILKRVFGYVHGNIKAGKRKNAGDDDHVGAGPSKRSKISSAKNVAFDV